VADLGDFSAIGATGARYQLFNQGSLTADTATTQTLRFPPAACDAVEIVFGQSEGHFILSWSAPQSFVINHNSYLGDELRVLALGTNLPAYVLASLSLDAAGIDSLAVSAGRRRRRSGPCLLRRSRPRR